MNPAGFIEHFEKAYIRRLQRELQRRHREQKAKTRAVRMAVLNKLISR